MGLIYIAVGTLANIMFRNMGMENDKAAFWSSILGFPYTFKFLWAPALELYKTKKFFVVVMQFAISLALVGVAIGLRVPGGGWAGPVLTLMAITAVLGATQDIGTDGVYVTTLSPKEQAKYLGFQSMCWNGGALLAKGPFLSVSGILEKSTGSYASAWMIVMLAMGGFVFVGGLWHSRILPPGAKAIDAPKSFGDAMGTFERRAGHVLPEEGHRAPHRLRLPLSLRLRPARQDGAAVPDRQPRQPRARALEPGRRPPPTALSAPAPSSSGRWSAAGSSRRRG